MQATTIPRIKICCISSIDEAKMAIRYGASALGLVSEMPSGPGVISEALIAGIAEQTPPPIATFLLTSKQSVAEIVEQQKRCRTNTIQICDRLLEGSHADLKAALPGISIVQVIHVIDQSSVEEAVSVAPAVDAILLDSGNQKRTVKQLGGTGRTHDWRLSQEIRKAVNEPIFLAGGLNPKNVVKAVEQVGAFGLDVCSGVRTNGRLNESKLAAFVDNIRTY